MQPPKTFDSRTMQLKTYWDVMGYQDREKVFHAYDYIPERKTYELKRPELLTEDIIKKLQ